MADNLAGSDHRKILLLARGYQDPFNPSNAADPKAPLEGYISATGDAWQKAGAAAVDVARGLETARDQLMSGGDGGGWHGDAADEFKKKLEQVIWFAREIAHRCDATNPKPPAPAQDGEVFRASDDGGDDNGFRQLFDDLGGYVGGVQCDDKLPPPEWDNTSYYIHWWNHDDTVHYEIRRGDGDGPILDLPKAGANDVERDKMYDYYHQANAATTESHDGDTTCLLPAHNKDYDATFKALEMNRDQKAKCQETAGNLATKYSDTGGKFPQPAQPPQIGSATPDSPGTGAGPGAGPGAGGTPPPFKTPDAGDRPDLDTSDITDHPDPTDSDNDGIPDSHDPYPHDPDNNVSDDNYNLPDSDNDGIPDAQDPFPHNPDHNHDGIPDGRTTGTSPGDIDTGTQTARVGAGGGGVVGTAGGSPGGLPGAMHGGGPTTSTGGAIPGTSTVGAGVIGGGSGPGGISGGANPAATGMRGGGMMPMMGGGGGQDGGQEQERNTWLDEDEDVWGADGDAPPPVIGG